MKKDNAPFEQTCIPFPGLANVNVCIRGDAASGNPIEIEYKIRDFNDAACKSCDLASNESKLHGISSKLLASIADFLNDKKPLDSSLLSESIIDASFKTAFSKKVITALRQTKPGDRLTYGELARLAGSPGAARAVGNVMRHNPFPIIIPCHRVVSPGGLGGYSGDVRGISLDIKQHLLDIETFMKQVGP
ncbi:MAG TPA: MGMT family protein [Candidatus Lokiarchaeia archaeon]|nr:MGMT family protein [Candidatus Lokiarchaeia archaeon]